MHHYRPASSSHFFYPSYVHSFLPNILPYQGTYILVNPRNLLLYCPAIHFSLWANQSLPSLTVTSVTSMVTLPAGLFPRRSPPPASPPLGLCVHSPPRTLEKAFFYRSGATHDSALEEHVTFARLDTPLPSVRAGPPCILGGGALRVQASWLLVAALAGRGNCAWEGHVSRYCYS